MTRSHLGHIGDFVDAGPDDHGALFDFGFGIIEAGQSKTFTTFYGAAGNEADAKFALTQAGAEVYSLGQPSYDGRGWDPAPYQGAGRGSYGATTGEPNTFIFGFRSVGGAPIFTPLDITLFISPAQVSLSRTNTLSVWVPSTAEFDATRLVPGSATLGNESDPEAAVAVRPNGTTWYATGDFNRDGYDDMMLVFLVSELKANGDLHSGTNRLVLRASHETEGLVRADGPVSVFP